MRKYYRLIKKHRFNKAAKIVNHELEVGNITEDEWYNIMDRIAWAYACRVGR